MVMGILAAMDIMGINTAGINITDINTRAIDIMAKDNTIIVTDIRALEKNKMSQIAFSLQAICTRSSI